MAKVTRLTLDNGGLERRRLHLREIAEADAPLDTVGQDLRNARTRKGEDLAQVAAILKIRKDHLDALEESQFDALPGRTYAIGFVRTYAAYLGLDGAQCIERLKAEMAGRIDNKDGAIAMTPPEARNLPQGWLIFAAILVIAIAYGGYYFVTSANRIAGETAAQVPARLEAEAAPAADTTVSPAAPPAAAPAVTANAAPAVTANAAPPTPAAISPSTPAPAPSAALPAAAAAKTLPEGQKYGLGNAGSRITLLVHREGRVDVFTPEGNRVFLGRILKPGDSYRLPNLPGIRLNVADAGAVEVLVDGKSVGYAGMDGVAAMDVNTQDFLKRQPG
jgi:cytoskeleton protein RodZ